jgi:hypothetical protein
MAQQDKAMKPCLDLTDVLAVGTIAKTVLPCLSTSAAKALRLSCKSATTEVMLLELRSGKALGPVVATSLDLVNLLMLTAAAYLVLTLTLQLHGPCVVFAGGQTS